MRRQAGLVQFLGVSLLALLAIFLLFYPRGRQKDIDIHTASQLIERGSVASAELTGEVLTLRDAKGDVLRTQIPLALQSAFYEDVLRPAMRERHLGFAAKSNAGWSSLIRYFPYIILLLFMVQMWVQSRRMRQVSPPEESFAQSHARVYDPSTMKKITFADVAGLVEEKAELYEIVDFLKHPEKFSHMGARIPRGVLLVGPPGTGKTYIARAVAGEAGVPFFSMSGSEFLEMFVGVGAKRVRDLFEQAKKQSPCIVFIDEIDGVGRMRGSGLGGGHDEREQTLNQLLVEMDGFEGNSGVIIMAATNRPDILDPALLRPGRFDRTVMVGLPDVRGREEVLKIHTAGKPLADDVDLADLAKRTPGFSPADLENLVNEAALLSARKNLREIPKAVLDEASIKVLAGPEKKSAVVLAEEKKLVSYHEAGHAVVASAMEHSDPVHMVTIVPRGRAGGFTFTVPEEERSYHTKHRMLDELAVLLGGRAAEELMLGDISTGASNDIKRATDIVRAMITRFGMSERLGTVHYAQDEEEIFLGKTLGHSAALSDEVLRTIDEEMHRLLDEAYARAKDILIRRRSVLIRLAETLMEKETIYRAEFESILRPDADATEGPAHVHA